MAPRAGSWANIWAAARDVRMASLSPLRAVGSLPLQTGVYITLTAGESCGGCYTFAIVRTCLDSPSGSTVVWVGGKSGEGTTRAREALQRPLSSIRQRTVMRASPRTNSAE
jgi:hypothetical protein